jgi:oxygen-dependent protoporphyrinogen oxidase
METLPQRLADSPGVCFCGDHTVTAVSSTRDGWRVTARTAAGERVIKVAQLVLSTPAYTAAALLREQCVEIATLLDGIEYTSLNVVHTGFDRGSISHPLDGNGFLAQGVDGTPLIGSLWMSSLFEQRAPVDRTLLSNIVGGARHPGVVDWSDARLLDATITALRPLLGIRSHPDMVHIDRHRRAMPLYHGDYFARMERLQRLTAAQPGLHLNGNYLGGVAVRDRLANAMHTASLIVRKAHEPTSKTYSLPPIVPLPAEHPNRA